MSYAATHDQHDDHHGAPKGFFRRWCMSTNHKDIGTLYLIFSLTMLFIGGSFAMLIRAALFTPGMQQIGRASCTDRVCQYVYISVVAASLQKTKHRNRQHR